MQISCRDPTPLPRSHRHLCDATDRSIHAGSGANCERPSVRQQCGRLAGIQGHSCAFICTSLEDSHWPRDYVARASGLAVTHRQRADERVPVTERLPCVDRGAKGCRSQGVPEGRRRASICVPLNRRDRWPSPTPSTPCSANTVTPRRDRVWILTQLPDRRTHRRTINQLRQRRRLQHLALWQHRRTRHPLQFHPRFGRHLRERNHARSYAT